MAAKELNVVKSLHQSGKQHVKSFPNIMVSFVRGIRERRHRFLPVEHGKNKKGTRNAGNVKTMRRVRKSDRGVAEPCLPGFAVQRLDGLFFSIFPDQRAAVRIANIAEHFRRAYGLNGAPLLIDRFHATVQGLGNYDGLPRSVVAKATVAGAAVMSRPFEVAFDRVTSFAGSDALVLRGGDGVDGIVMFHHDLGVAMRKSGLSADSQFTPHITLLYERRRIEEHFIEPIRWTVRDFVLVHSLRGRTKHIPLERWHLGG